mgnify:CR=1 FL=1
MGKSFSEIINEMITMPNIQWPEVWTAIVETLYMTVVSTIFAFILGLILGVLLFLSAKGKSIGARLFYSIVSFIVNLFRAIPFIILIINSIYKFDTWNDKWSDRCVTSLDHWRSTVLCKARRNCF